MIRRHMPSLQKPDGSLTGPCLLVVALALFTSGCMGGPVRGTPVSTGPNSVEVARKALQGTWQLLSLDVAADDGRRTPVAAKGELKMDDFANLNIEYRISDEGIRALGVIGVKSPNPVITTSGQVVIDPAGRRVTYVGADQLADPLDAGLAARRANPFALERVRYYNIGADGILTLTTRHDSGRDAATSRWQRMASDTPPPAPPTDRPTSN